MMRLRKKPIVVTMVLGVFFLTGEARDGLQKRCAAVAAQPVANSATAYVFVSPKGNDRWSGRLADPGGNDGPFATIARAREAADPLFVAPKNGDFRLRQGSPAAKIGFEPWDLTAVGPRPHPAASKQD